jgi:4-amino-4-deoxy-L-arabinose transferase-like glycosyltransferase
MAGATMISNRSNPWVSRSIFLALLLYAAAMVATWPRVINVSDEADYVYQAVVFARGERDVEQVNPRTGQSELTTPSTYPPATSFLQAPFAYLFGWRGAHIASLVALVAFMLLLRRWLIDEGLSPAFTLFALAYPPTLFMGRLAMSDLPSGAAICFGYWCFFRGIRGRGTWWLASGFTAGVSLLWRDSNPLFFVPLFAGAVIRREAKSLFLVLGGLAGLAIRLVINAVIFGNPFFVRPGAAFRFTLDSVPVNLPVYLIASVIMVPLGLVAAALYRGRRWPEVVATVALVLLFFSTYVYGAQESGFFRRLILAPRYLIPLVPLLVLSMAEAGPRLLPKLSHLAYSGRAAVLGALLISFAAGLIHVGLFAWERVQAPILSTIYTNTSTGSVVFHDFVTTHKYVSPVYGERVSLWIDEHLPEKVGERLGSGRPVFLVLLDRSDTEFFVQRSRSNQALIERLQGQYSLKLRWSDPAATKVGRLRVWQVDRRGATPSP